MRRAIRNRQAEPELALTFKRDVDYGFHFAFATSLQAMNFPPGSVSLVSISCGQRHGI
jgi:urease beta subunit